MKTKQTKPEAKHTPTLSLARQKESWAIDVDGQPKAEIFHAYHGGEDQAETFGKRIVEAVNNYEKLKRDNKALLEKMEVAYQYFNTLANTPDEKGYVLAPDSMDRVILRMMTEVIAQYKKGE